MIEKQLPLWRSPDFWSLVLYKAQAGLRSEASRYYLNLAWWVFDPILSMSVYYLVFGVLLERGGPDFVQFLLVGLVTWNWFGNTLRHASHSIRTNAGLMLQVVIPKVFFPTVVVAMDTAKFLVVMSLLLLFLWSYGFPISETYVALPILLLVQWILIMGASYWLAGVVPFLPDLVFLIDAFLTLLFFLSGIFYSPERIPEQYQTYFFLNPMAVLIDSYRDVLMYQTWPNWDRLAGVLLVGLALLVSGSMLIRRCEYIYPRLVGR